MATCLVGNKTRVVAYLPNLRSVVRHFRAFSSYDENKPANEYPELDIADDVHPNWPDSKLGPLNPSNQRFPLPGYVGVHNPRSRHAANVQQPATQREESDLFSGMLPSERHTATLRDFLTASKEFEGAEGEEAALEQRDHRFDKLECVVQDCPQLLRKDLQSLFPDRNIMHGAFTVISISQQTVNDMSAWNRDVEEEREALLDSFVSGASGICDALQSDGYWADFIDPTSGRPYRGQYTNSTLFETDERYRHFGFEIEDLGCCKVVKHHLWGTHAYVGCLFTNAPLSHPALAEFNRK